MGIGSDWGGMRWSRGGLDKKLASCLRACIWSSPMGVNGVLGCELERVAVSFLATSMAASDGEVAGILYSLGKNSTVRAIRSLPLLGTPCGSGSAQEHYLCISRLGHTVTTFDELMEFRRQRL